METRVRCKVPRPCTGCALYHKKGSINRPAKKVPKKKTEPKRPRAIANRPSAAEKYRLNRIRNNLCSKRWRERKLKAIEDEITEGMYEEEKRCVLTDERKKLREQIILAKTTIHKTMGACPTCNENDTVKKFFQTYGPETDIKYYEVLSKLIKLKI